LLVPSRRILLTCHDAIAQVLEGTSAIVLLPSVRRSVQPVFQISTVPYWAGPASSVVCLAAATVASPPCPVVTTGASGPRRPPQCRPPLCRVPSGFGRRPWRVPVKDCMSVKCQPVTCKSGYLTRQAHPACLTGLPDTFADRSTIGPRGDRPVAPTVGGADTSRRTPDLWFHCSLLRDGSLGGRSNRRHPHRHVDGHSASRFAVTAGGRRRPAGTTRPSAAARPTCGCGAEPTARCTLSGAATRGAPTAAAIGFKNIACRSSCPTPRLAPFVCIGRDRSVSSSPSSRVRCEWRRHSGSEPARLVGCSSLPRFSCQSSGSHLRQTPPQ